MPSKLSAVHLPFVKRLLIAPLIAGIFASCHRVTDPMQITQTREISANAQPPQTEITSSADRFGDDRKEEQSKQIENPLTFVTPEGWTEVPPEKTPGGLRLINLRFGPAGEGECYLTIMPGAAGGVEANVNRWRGQMGQPPYTKEEIEKLPHRKFIGRDAFYVAFDGDFKAVGATEAAKNSRLVGIIQPAETAVAFLKMTGPKELVEKNEAAFAQLVESIHVKQ